jgi:hypothetical protein
MHRSRLVVSILVGLGLIFLSTFSYGEEPAPEKKTTTEKAEECVYVGVKKCAFCHVRLDDSVKTWAITKHANAYAVLRTPEAHKYSDAPDEDPKCLKCHMTGMMTDPAAHIDEALYSLSPPMLEGVQCEMCHGAGEDYRNEMARALPKYRELDEKECTRKGLLAPSEEACRKCHNEECPVFEGFDFEIYKNMIKHGTKEVKCTFVGQEKCTFCHVKADDTAKTWVIWKHINSFSVLKTKLAEQFSADPVHDEKCLECHVTGFKTPGGYAVDDAATQGLEGVQCEMCHGWGYSYVGTMARAKILDVHGVKEECERNGLVIPDKKVCIQCHNERCPVYTGFDFEASLKQLKHGESFKKH